MGLDARIHEQAAEPSGFTPVNAIDPRDRYYILKDGEVRKVRTYSRFIAMAYDKGVPTSWVHSDDDFIVEEDDHPKISQFEDLSSQYPASKTSRLLHGTLFSTGQCDNTEFAVPHSSSGDGAG
ncbi:uncharacterized protein H6S33_003276 [Morchella sextelata]|uniref:uncharacterized protein n=1 Tax=Morchella sextelata TaxID=1174677 RepID=UPI001D03A33A|nr:uncharacterized protein H6S33_003276 [Morchella sextelata]KAH0607288.1 hypothetical protein H6S33_003276 [Morchella sextelata]